MYLYTVTSTATEKVYVGVTTSKNPIRRWQAHLSTAKNNRSGARLLNNAIRKYGVETFTFTPILEAESIEELYHLEKIAIQHFNSLAPNGYNLAEFGNKPSEDGAKRISEKLMGNTNASGEREFDFKRRMADVHRTCETYEFTSPTGEKFFHPYLSEFCRENGIRASNLLRTLSPNSGRKTANGWSVKRVYGASV